MSPSKNVAAISSECVACGNCVRACPRNSISVYRGKYATVDLGICAGCGKCADMCPASVISVVPREG